MNPLIEGLDGRKMSSSWGNSINLTDNAEEMYGKVMSLNDEYIGNYFELCTRLPLDETKEIKESLTKGELHPKEAKMNLAREVVSLFLGEEEVLGAEESFINTFQKKELPKDVKEVKVGKGTLLVDALIDATFVSSKSEFRRLVESGGIHIVEGENTTTITNTAEVVEKSVYIKIGKRRFIYIVV
jgi:tyrosyl-tRNA synthetase